MSSLRKKTETPVAQWVAAILLLLALFELLYSFTLVASTLIVEVRLLAFGCLVAAIYFYYHR